MLSLLNAHAPLIYGAVVGAVLFLAALSRRPMLQKLALLLLSAWAGCNMLEVIFPGYTSYTAAALSVMDATLCSIALMITLPPKSQPGITIACLFAFEVLTLGAFIYTHTQGGILCYLTTNAEFFAQCLILGGVSGRSFLVGRRRRRHLFPAGRLSGA